MPKVHASNLRLTIYVVTFVNLVSYVCAVAFASGANHGY